MESLITSSLVTPGLHISSGDLSLLAPNDQKALFIMVGALNSCVNSNEQGGISVSSLATFSYVIVPIAVKNLLRSALYPSSSSVDNPTTPAQSGSPIG